eukprot:s5455_g1.t1
MVLGVAVSIVVVVVVVLLLLLVRPLLPLAGVVLRLLSLPWWLPVTFFAMSHTFIAMQELVLCLSPSRGGAGRQPKDAAIRKQHCRATAPGRDPPGTTSSSPAATSQQAKFGRSVHTEMLPDIERFGATAV